jgi:PAS domain S-box-containing protein
MEAERRNNVAHSQSTVVNADADLVGCCDTLQDLCKAECTVLKAGMAEDTFRKPAEHSDLVSRQATDCHDAAPRDRGHTEQEFNGFPEAAPDAVVIADRDGRIIRVNAQAEKLFGYPRGELLGREVEILMPERFRGRHVEQRTAYFTNPGTRPMGTSEQLYALRKDGYEFPAQISLSPLSVKDGFVVASAIRDVTEHRRLEEELRQRTRELEDAARHKDEFLGMLAHELRNPLGTIRNAVQVLKQFGPPDPNLQWAQDVIVRQSDHMAHLVEDLLDASRIAHGKVRIQKEPIELGRVVDQAVEACRSLLSTRKQQVTVSLPSRRVRLLADPTRLVQVLTNLLNNAAKYTDEGGQIWLTTTAEEGEVVVRVRDNGIGIAAAMLPRVFDLFTQVPAALGRAEGGVGIGLAMVGHLVQLHGGTVQAFSDGPGQGSEFVVRLPLLAATCAARDDAGETGDVPAESPPRRILIADDNRDLAEAVAQLLRRRGHEVCVAGDGPAALAAAHAFKPEVVFLDIELPVLSGYEVARRLREQPGLENVLLVATTGYAEEEVRDRAHEAGFDAHLAKPFGVDAVLRFLADGRPGGYAGPRGQAALV